MDIMTAIENEKKIKGWRREKKEALINDEWDKLPELSIAYIRKNKPITVTLSSSKSTVSKR